MVVPGGYTCDVVLHTIRRQGAIRTVEAGTDRPTAISPYLTPTSMLAQRYRESKLADSTHARHTRADPFDCFEHHIWKLLCFHVCRAV